mmetsp:Transcript_35501/g.80116  ORF Transcript_35501/g.80116 Transcript_35501/m.80116 type:complete len:307 (+) Transcript_35501:284-1204(+)
MLQLPAGEEEQKPDKQEEQKEGSGHPDDGSAVLQGAELPLLKLPASSALGVDGSPSHQLEPLDARDGHVFSVEHRAEGPDPAVGRRRVPPAGYRKTDLPRLEGAVLETLRINFAEGLLGERVAGHAGYVHMLEGNNDRLVGSDDSMARLWVHATSPTSPHAKELIAHAALAAAVLEDARTYHEELDASWEDLAAAVAQVDDGDAHRSFAAVEAIAGEGPVVATAAIGCRSRHDPSVCRLGRVEERADGVAPVGGEAKDPGRANGGASVDELDRLQLQGIFVVHEVTRAGVSPSDDVSFRHVHLILF